MSQTNNPQLAWLEKQIAALEQELETLDPVTQSQQRNKVKSRIYDAKFYRDRLLAGTVGIAPFIEIGEL